MPTKGTGRTSCAGPEAHIHFTPNKVALAAGHRHTASMVTSAHPSFEGGFGVLQCLDLHHTQEWSDHILLDRKMAQRLRHPGPRTSTLQSSRSPDPSLSHGCGGAAQPKLGQAHNRWNHHTSDSGVIGHLGSCAGR
jgi:hypothetical protein